MSSVLDIVGRFKGVQQVPGHNKWRVCCPAHDDRNSSAFVELKENGYVKLHCSAGCTEQMIMEAIGLHENRDLYCGPEKERDFEKKQQPAAKKVTGKGPLETQYLYRNAKGEIVARKDRFAALPGGRKSFAWWRVDDFDGSFLSGMDKTERPLYQLHKVVPAVQSGKPIWFVEGEKCVEALEALDLVATTLPDGASCHWTDQQIDSLRGAAVLILPDHDEPGEKYAAEAVDKLTGAAKSVKVVRLPGMVDMPPKSDVVDWLAAGHSKEELIEAANSSEEAQDKIPQYIKEMNECHAVIKNGGSPRILNEYTDQEGHHIDIWKPSDMDVYYANRKIQVVEGNKLKDIPVSKLWLAHKHRREYSKIVFEPSGCLPDQYNMWRGFAIQPEPGDWSLLQEHILENLCSGNAKHYDYLLAWMARICQDPGGPRPGVAIVMRGCEGTGKGILANNFGEIFGPHFVPIHNQTQLTGRFTEHLKSALVIFLDEAMWGGDKNAEGVLKGIITEEKRTVEPKGKDAYTVRNHANIIMASNNEWVVPAGANARRFFVLNVSDRRMQDSTYFSAIQRQMDNGGREAMLYDLLRLDISGVNLRDIDRTDALMEQIEHTMGSVEQFWFVCLKRGWIMNEMGGWGMVAVSDLYDSYLEWCRALNIRYPKHEIHFGRTLKVISGVSRTRRRIGDGGRNYFYEFPDLEECRICFNRTVNISVDWEEGDFREEDHDVPF